MLLVWLASLGLSASCSDGVSEQRVLRGHHFLLPRLVDSALVLTYFGSRLIAAELQVPALPTRIGSFDILSASIGEAFDLSIAIAHVVAIQLRVLGTIDSGVNFNSIVLGGISLSGGGELDVPVRLLRDEKSGSQLSLRAFAAAATESTGSLAALIEESVMTSIAQLLRGNLAHLLIRPTQSLAYGGALALAQTIVPQLSLQLSTRVYATTLKATQFSVASETEKTTTTTVVSLQTGGALTVDLARNHLPIAVLAEYLFSADFNAFRNASNTIAAGLFYSGQSHLQLGVEASTGLGLSKVNIGSGVSKSPRRYEGEFVMYYLW
jgi:hypothetical protein